MISIDNSIRNGSIMKSGKKKGFNQSFNADELPFTDQRFDWKSMKCRPAGARQLDHSTFGRNSMTTLRSSFAPESRLSRPPQVLREHDHTNSVGPPLSS